MLTNDLVNNSLMRCQRVNVLLLDLGAGITRRVEKDLVGDAFAVVAIGLTSSSSENANSKACVAGGRIRDPRELVVSDNVWFEPPLRAGGQNVMELLVVVPVHVDVLAGAEAAHEAVIDAPQQFFFSVGDADDGKLGEAVEIIDDAWIFELVDLVKDDDSPGTIVLLEPVDEFVVGGGLAVDINSFPEIVEDLIDGAEAGVVAPAVNVGGFDVQNFFAKAFSDELRDTGFAAPAGTSDDSGIGRLAVRERSQDAGEMVDFGVAMFDLARNKSSTKDTSIADHIGLARVIFRQILKVYPSRFRKTVHYTLPQRKHHHTGRRFLSYTWDLSPGISGNTIVIAHGLERWSIYFDTNAQNTVGNHFVPRKE